MFSKSIYQACRQVGDGTTTVVILAGEFLREAKAFIEEGVHPQSIIRSFREAGRLATEQIREQSVVLGDKSDAEMRDLLQKCASTSLNSKLVSPFEAAPCSCYHLLVPTIFGFLC